MATAAERRAYARKLNSISKQHQRLERETLQASIRLLKSVRDQIAGQLTGTEFNEFRIAEQTAQLNAIINEYDAQLRSLANGAVRQSFDLGERSVIEPLQELDLTGVFFRPSEAQVDILAQFSADLVGGVTEDMRRKVNRTIRMSALGGQSSLDAMRQITKDLGIPTRRTARAKGVSYEAERILRTETSRTYSLAAFSQGQKVAEDIPGTQKRWMSTGDGRTRSAHLNAHGQTVGMNEKFKFSDPRGNYELMYPGDPAGPSYGTINERCRMIVIPPDFDAVELPVDKQVEKEQGKRERQAFKKKDEIALIEQGGIDIFADIRPPSGRAPRGRGEEYNQRRRIVSRIQTQMKYRSQAEQQLQQYRGQTSHRLRWRIDVAKTRVQQLNKSITAMLDIAGDPLAEDWGFKSELIDGIIDYTSELRVMAA